MKWLCALAAVCFSTGAAANVGPTVTVAVSQGGGSDWCLNELLIDCDQFWNGVFETPVIRGAFKVVPNYSYKPDLVRNVVVHTHPMRVLYFIKGQALWSDGVPVTAKDFRFTWRTVMARRLVGHVDRTGYDRIASVRGSGKTVLVKFKRAYGDWKSLFRYVLPEHALEGSDISLVWNSAIVNPKTGQPIGDGPYLLTQFDRSGEIVLERNPRWWGSPKPRVASIAFRVVRNYGEVLRMLRGGAVDAYYSHDPQPLPLGGPYEGFRFQADRGSRWIHLNIDQGPQGQPLARKLWVRQAIAYAIDRRAVTTAVVDSLWPVQPLNSVVYLRDERNYVPHWAKWKANPVRAESILRAHGCTKGEDGIYVCDGQRLAFAVNAASVSNRSAFDAISAELARVGIEARITVAPSGGFGSFVAPSPLEVVTEDVRSDPSVAARLWECGGSLLTIPTCDRHVDRILRNSDRVLDPRRRATLRNQADALLADDLWTIPLFQLPSFFVYHSTLTGVREDPGVGPTWNAEAWQVR